MSIVIFDDKGGLIDSGGKLIEGDWYMDENGNYYRDDEKKFDERYLDIYGNVLPSIRKEDKPCDNGILFSSVAIILGYNLDYINLVREAYIKRGLVGRWKGNDYDLPAWDDYLGVFAACIYIGNKALAREILWYGTTHFFFFNPTNKFDKKAFLGRSAHIWLLAICAAFPFLKLFLKYPLKLVTVFFKTPVELLERNDSSGLQLQFVFLAGCSALGFHFDKNNQHWTYRAKMFQQYYPDPIHPFNRSIS